MKKNISVEINENFKQVEMNREMHIWNEDGLTS